MKVIVVCSSKGGVGKSTLTAHLAVQASGALSKHGPVSEVAVGSRVAFATSMTDGRTVVELEPGSRSSTEVADLWKEIVGMMKGEGA